MLPLFLTVSLENQPFSVVDQVLEIFQKHISVYIMIKFMCNRYASHTIGVPCELPISFNLPNPASCSFFIASTAADLCPLFLKTFAFKRTL